MRIVKARVAAVAAPFPSPLWPTPKPISTNTAVVVHLEERDGCVGFGYLPTFGFATRALSSIIADDLAPQLLGAELEASDEAVRVLVASTALSGRLAGASRMAIAALECALLDIEAQLAGVALHQMWGSTAAPTRAYASGGWRYLPIPALVGFANAAVDRGFSAVKVQVGLSLEEDLTRVRAVREAVGPDVAVMLDANELIPVDSAAKWLRALAPMAPTWVEEPTPARDHRVLAALRADSSCPIAAGESETELCELDDLVETRAVDVIQPDVFRVGLSALRAVARSAVEAGLEIAPHMAHELSGHVTTISPVPCWLEYFDWFEDWWDEPIMPAKGELTPSIRPGHGLQLRSGWLRNHTIWRNTIKGHTS